MAPGAPQLTPTHIGDPHWREKLAVLTQHATQALLSEATFDAGPAVQALCEQAARDHPQAITVGAHGDATAHHLGWSLHGNEPVGDGPAEIGACLRALPPQSRLTALLCLAFAEDFAVIDGATGRIPWLAVCLPSHWSPADKIGRHFAEVHAPVADNQTLITASDHLARLVTGTDRWVRPSGPTRPSPGSAPSTRLSSRCRASARRYSRSMSRCSRCIVRSRPLRRHSNCTMRSPA
jgi:dimethylamine monooxygenase subunit A